MHTSNRHTFKRLILAAALTTVMGSALALDPVVSWNPRTGDAWVDTRLGDINQYGTRYRAPFVNEIVRHYGAPRSLVDELLARRGWTPGDVYYACSIARAAGRPCREVADAYDRERGQGWGVIAQRMGIKPGSAEFHALKRGFVPTYDRWGRPIELDADLRRAYPDRVKKARKDKAVAKAGKPGKSDKTHTHDGMTHKAGKAHGAAHKGDHGKPASKDKGKSRGQGKDKDKSKGQGKDRDKSKY